MWRAATEKPKTKRNPRRKTVEPGNVECVQPIPNRRRRACRCTTSKRSRKIPRADGRVENGDRNGEASRGGDATRRDVGALALEAATP